MLYAGTSADSKQCTHTNPERSYIGMQSWCDWAFIWATKKRNNIDQLFAPSEYYNLSSENKLKRILHVHEFCSMKKKTKKNENEKRRSIV